MVSTINACVSPPICALLLSSSILYLLIKLLKIRGALIAGKISVAVIISGRLCFTMLPMSVLAVFLVLTPPLRLDRHINMSYTDTFRYFTYIYCMWLYSIVKLTLFVRIPYKL